jgi:hypothetical protein
VVLLTKYLPYLENRVVCPYLLHLLPMGPLANWRGPPSAAREGGSRKVSGLFTNYDPSYIRQLWCPQVAIASES